MTTNARRRGRPSGASPEAVLEAARSSFRRGERVDAQALSSSLGISRTSVYRWFGTRDQLMGEVLAAELRVVMDTTANRVTTRGAERVVDTVISFCSHVAGSKSLEAYVKAEPLIALHVITGSNGRVQPAAIRTIEELLERVEAEDGYSFRISADVLAFTIVRLTEAFLYTQYDESVVLNCELDNLRTVLTQLL